ncbi:uncharacterized protein PV09_04655 [Verruconis gallopava]|uniref:Potassium channel domain-containing protein n=1 Tax=Verruconis gallopava TaxID=253628 RepID=A0A0D1XP75_9PEZI|nr:uncharacterized protein PV09_04655 [Verruconis gallopava]KIW04371.1 hypothetical protein PV09_04655 [Verruconis gallopava]
MPQSLVHEFLEQRASGTKLGAALKAAAFQAKPPDIELGQVEDSKPKFKLWKVHMRGLADDDPVDWWFASTGIPILAATLGPLANVLSIGALVTYWRIDLADEANPGRLLSPLQGVYIKDPTWCYAVNLTSLVLGFIGNLFLLLNFTQQLRYLIALPLTVVMWFIACGMLIGDLSAMKVYAPPEPPYEQFSGGFWYGVAAACMYLLLATLLLVNMVGYIRGHYPQHFHLTEEQRTLIVQTMMFFLWLAGGAGVYSRLEKWHYIDALYYCDVTILTVGFGDLYPLTNAGRAILIPYSVGGIITLGLVIQAIYKSVQELGEKNIIRHHFEQQRERAKDRTVRSSLEMQRREIEIELANERAMAKQAARPSARSTGTAKHYKSVLERQNSMSSFKAGGTPSLALSRQSSMLKKSKRIVLLKEEKERFEAMRNIQRKAKTWRLWYRLVVSLTVFGSLWCIGAVFFWVAEKGLTGQTYWETIYFCWVALLSIGYGDFAPKTGSGRCFFIIWSLLAVPTMTVLAGDLSSTVVEAFNHGSNRLADLTVMPQNGLWRTVINKRSPLLLFAPKWLRPATEADRSQTKQESKDSNMNGDGTTQDPGRLYRTSTTQSEKDEEYAAGTRKAEIVDLVDQQERDAFSHPDATALARQLALAIRRTAHDLMMEKPRKYTYEEWVEFTRLIRFSAVGGPAEGLREEEEGMIEWDWIGADSPMMNETSESQFVLERLIESLVRYLKRNRPTKEFSETLKERGEEALKLKGGSAPDEDDDSVILPRSSANSVDTRSVRSWTGSALSIGGGQGATSIGALQPLHEHEDEHIHAGPHRTTRYREVTKEEVN